MRPGQHNKRNRNRHRSGGGGNNGGGNPLNRVYESNGPDVKVRGTAQTVAEKYLQLGRDAQSAGDSVMAESYYQHAEHYLRIVAAAQAYQQQVQQSYRRPTDEFDDEDGDDQPEVAAVEMRHQPASDDQPEIGEPMLDGERPAPQPNAYRQREAREPREQGGRDTREQGGRDTREQGGNRDRDPAIPRDQLPPQFGGNRDRRPRWQERREPGASGYEQPRQAAPQPRGDEPARSEAQPGAGDQWEAPSFLRRPSALPAAEPAAGQPNEIPSAPAAAAEAPRRPRGRPRRERPAETSEDTVAATVPEQGD